MGWTRIGPVAGGDLYSRDISPEQWIAGYRSLGNAHWFTALLAEHGFSALFAYPIGFSGDASLWSAYNALADNADTDQ